MPPKGRGAKATPAASRKATKPAADPAGRRNTRSLGLTDADVDDSASAASSRPLPKKRTTAKPAGLTQAQQKEFDKLLAIKTKEAESAEKKLAEGAYSF